MIKIKEEGTVVITKSSVTINGFTFNVDKNGLDFIVSEEIEPYMKEWVTKRMEELNYHIAHCVFVRKE